MTYQEARVYLDEVSKYGSVLGLDTIRGLLRELGDPQNDLKFIHIDVYKRQDVHCVPELVLQMRSSAR